MLTKTLTKVGNSYAILIDKGILDLLNITPETQLQVTTDGKVLTLSPIDAEEEKAFARSLKRVSNRYKKVFAKLA